jgi:hypothetical protein
MGGLVALDPGQGAGRSRVVQKIRCDGWVFPARFTALETREISHEKAIRFESCG